VPLFKSYYSNTAANTVNTNRKHSWVQSEKIYQCKTSCTTKRPHNKNWNLIINRNLNINHHSPNSPKHTHVIHVKVDYEGTCKQCCAWHIKVFLHCLNECSKQQKGTELTLNTKCTEMEKNNRWISVYFVSFLSL